MTDTPETDSEHQARSMGGFTLDFCRQLERERDDAIEMMRRTKNNSGEIIASQVVENIILTQERDSLIASLKFHAELNKELASEQSKLEKTLRALSYWRDISECVCSDPLPNGGCLRCDLDKIVNETKT